MIDPQRDDRNLGRFTNALEIIARAKANNKLFVAGNNDLEWMSGYVLRDYPQFFREILQKYDIHLLDQAPRVIDNVGFAGNIGWFDGTLWTKYAGMTSYPNDPESIRANVNQTFEHKDYPGITGGISSHEFYLLCTERINSDVDTLVKNPAVEKIVIGTHFVSSKKFVKGDTGEFAFLNWFMGAESHAELYRMPKVKLAFTGHTHRMGHENIYGVDIYNVSGDKQPVILEL